MVGYILGAIPFVLLVALGGRVLLSWLPPGSPGTPLSPGCIGAHRRGELATTFAVSWALAVGIIGVATRWAQLVGHEDWTGFLAIAAALALVARWLTLPAPMVPRHEPRAEHAGPPTWLVLFAIVATIVWKIAGDPLLGLLEQAGPMELDEQGLEDAQAVYEAWIVKALSFAIGSIAVAHGLRVARRAPLERSLVVLAAAVVTPLVDSPSMDFNHARAAFVLGLACAIAWWRRADRRALAVAALLFGTCALSRQTIALTLAGGIALVAGTAPASRRRAASWCLACTAVLGGHVPLSPPRAGYALGGVDLQGVTLTAIAVATAVVTGLVGRIGRSSAPRTAAGIDEPHRSVRGVGLALLCGALGLLATAELGGPTLADRPSWRLVPAALGPSAWLLFGLVLTRAERPPVRRDA